MLAVNRRFIDFFTSEDGSIGMEAIALTGAVLATSVLGEVIGTTPPYAADWDFHLHWDFHFDWPVIEQ